MKHCLSYLLWSIVFCLSLPACRKSTNNVANLSASELEFVEPSGDFRLERVGQILLEENENQLVSAPVAMDIGPNGDIYIADYRQNTIHHYDSTGRFIQRIGKLGSGPGEFRDLQKLRVVGDYLIAYDTRPRKLNFFDLSGNYLRTVITALGDSVFVGAEFDFTPDGKQFYVNAFDERYDVDTYCRKSYTFAIRDSNFALVGTGGNCDPFTWDRCELLGCDSIVRIGNDGKVYVLPKRVPRIAVYSPNLRLIGRFSFRMPSWQFPKPTNSPARFYQSHSGNDAVLVGPRSGRIYIVSRYFDREASRRQRRAIADFTLYILSATGELLCSAPMPRVGADAPIAIDEDEILYFFVERTPERLSIGKYRLLETSS